MPLNNINSEMQVLDLCEWVVVLIMFGMCVICVFAENFAFAASVDAQ